MKEIEFELRPEDEFIELLKLLKLKQIAQTGGHAKIIIEEGSVKVNGQPELQKRKKLRRGDTIEVDNLRIKILA
jgi:ribosome-associated protein